MAQYLNLRVSLREVSSREVVNGAQKLKKFLEKFWHEMGTANSNDKL